MTPILLAAWLFADTGAVKVNIELADGTRLRGELVQVAMPFEFEGGKAKLDASQLRSFSFGTNGAFPDTVETTSGTVIKGWIAVDSVTVRVDGEDRTLPRKQVARIRIDRSYAGTWVTRALIPLVTLSAMEIVLGIDNIIFLAIVAARLPKEQQPRARRLGLVAALLTRLGLLATLSFILGLTAPLWTLPDLPLMHELEARQISWRDVILLVGGLFLIGKSTYEIHAKVEHGDEFTEAVRPGRAGRFGMVLVEIAVIDIIFSLDSVITAVGMAEELWVMVAAMVIAVLTMMLFAERIAGFVARHPTIKVLALAFLILIGVLLVAEGLGQHLNKGYIYFAMAFSLVVEMVNIRLRPGPGSSHPPGVGHETIAH